MKSRDLVRAKATFSENSDLSVSPALELRSLEGYLDVVGLFRRVANE